VVLLLVIFALGTVTAPQLAPLAAECCNQQAGLLPVPPLGRRNFHSAILGSRSHSMVDNTDAT